MWWRLSELLHRLMYKEGAYNKGVSVGGSKVESGSQSSGGGYVEMMTLVR